MALYDPFSTIVDAKQRELDDSDQQAAQQRQVAQQQQAQQVEQESRAAAAQVAATQAAQAKQQAAGVEAQREADMRNFKQDGGRTRATVVTDPFGRQRVVDTPETDDAGKRLYEPADVTRQRTGKESDTDEQGNPRTWNRDQYGNVTAQNPFNSPSSIQRYDPATGRVIARAGGVERPVEIRPGVTSDVQTRAQQVQAEGQAAQTAKEQNRSTAKAATIQKRIDANDATAKSFEDQATEMEGKGDPDSLAAAKNLRGKARNARDGITRLKAALSVGAGPEDAPADDSGDLPPASAPVGAAAPGPVPQTDASTFGAAAPPVVKPPTPGAPITTAPPAVTPAKAAPAPGGAVDADTVTASAAKVDQQAKDVDAEYGPYIQNGKFTGSQKNFQAYQRDVATLAKARDEHAKVVDSYTSSQVGQYVNQPITGATDPIKQGAIGSTPPPGPLQQSVTLENPVSATGQQSTADRLLDQATTLETNRGKAAFYAENRDKAFAQGAALIPTGNPDDPVELNPKSFGSEQDRTPVAPSQVRPGGHGGPGTSSAAPAAGPKIPYWKDAIDEAANQGLITQQEAYAKKNDPYLNAAEKLGQARDLGAKTPTSGHWGDGVLADQGSDFLNSQAETDAKAGVDDSGWGNAASWNPLRGVSLMFNALGHVSGAIVGSTANDIKISRERQDAQRAIGDFSGPEAASVLQKTDQYMEQLGARRNIVDPNDKGTMSSRLGDLQEALQSLQGYTGSMGSADVFLENTMSSLLGPLHGAAFTAKIDEKNPDQLAQRAALQNSIQNEILTKFPNSALGGQVAGSLGQFLVTRQLGAMVAGTGVGLATGAHASEALGEGIGYGIMGTAQSYQDEPAAMPFTDRILSIGNNALTTAGSEYIGDKFGESLTHGLRLTAKPIVRSILHGAGGWAGEVTSDILQDGAQGKDPFGGLWDSMKGNMWAVGAFALVGVRGHIREAKELGAQQKELIEQNQRIASVLDTKIAGEADAQTAPRQADVLISLDQLKNPDSLAPADASPAERQAATQSVALTRDLIGPENVDFLDQRVKDSASLRAEAQKPAEVPGGLSDNPEIAAVQQKLANGISRSTAAAINGQVVDTAQRSILAHAEAAQEITGIQRETPRATAQVQQALIGAVKVAQGREPSAIERASLLATPVLGPDGAPLLNGTKPVMMAEGGKDGAVTLSPQAMLKLGEIAPKTVALIDQYQQLAAEEENSDGSTKLDARANEGARNPTKDNAASPASTGAEAAPAASDARAPADAAPRLAPEEDVVSPDLPQEIRVRQADGTERIIPAADAKGVKEFRKTLKPGDAVVEVNPAQRVKAGSMMAGVDRGDLSGEERRAVHDSAPVFEAARPGFDGLKVKAARVSFPEGVKSFGLRFNPDNNRLEVDPKLLAASRATMGAAPYRQRLEKTLMEERIHASSKAAFGDDHDPVMAALWHGATDEARQATLAGYGADPGTDEGRGSEYFRMLVQKAEGGDITELAGLAQNHELRPFLQRLMDYLKGVLKSDPTVQKMVTRVQKVMRAAEAIGTEAAAQRTSESAPLPDVSGADRGRAPPGDRVSAVPSAPTSSGVVAPVSMEGGLPTPQTGAVAAGESAPAGGESTRAKPSAGAQLGEAITERGRKVPFRYRLGNAFDIKLASGANQPRDREGRVGSDSQITKIAKNLQPELLGPSAKASDGAPMTYQGEVLSGNGRTMALQEAYGNPRYRDSVAKYRDYLRQVLPSLGIDPGELNGNTAPYLHREIAEDMTPEQLSQFAVEANEQGQMTLSPSEQAKIDAKQLTPDVLGSVALSPDGSLDLTSAANAGIGRAFFKTISQADIGKFVDRRGHLSREGAQRIKNALMQKAYGDDEAGQLVISKLAESLDNDVARRVSAMLTSQAANVARYQDLQQSGDVYPLALGGDLAAAAQRLQMLREAGKKVSDDLSQGELGNVVSLTPIQRLILQTFDTAPSDRFLIDTVSDYFDRAHVLGNPKQADLMGGPNPDKVRVWAAAVAKATKERAARIQYSGPVPPGAMEYFRHALPEEKRAIAAAFEKLKIPQFSQLEPDAFGLYIRPKVLPGEVDGKANPLPGAHPLLTPTNQLAQATITEENELAKEGILAPGTYDRSEFHAAVIKYVSTKGAPITDGRKPILYSTAGGGGAGKSTGLKLLRAQGKLQDKGAVQVNADDIKDLIPEFIQIKAIKNSEGLSDGRAAGVVHEESSMLAKEVMRRLTDPAAPVRYDVMYDATMSDGIKGGAEIANWKKAGFHVRMIAVTIDPLTAIARAALRGVNGRWVANEILYKAHLGFNRAFDEYASLVDEADLLDNTGENPVKLARYEGGKLVEKGSSEGYSNYERRRNLPDTYGNYEQTSPEGVDAVARPDSRRVGDGSGEAARLQTQRGGAEAPGGDRGEVRKDVSGTGRLQYSGPVPPNAGLEQSNFFDLLSPAQQKEKQEEWTPLERAEWKNPKAPTLPAAATRGYSDLWQSVDSDNDEHLEPVYTKKRVPLTPEESARVAQFQPLAGEIAGQYRNIDGTTTDERLSVVNQALVRAARNYTPDRGDFGRYAGVAMSNSMKDMLRTSSRNREDTTLDAPISESDDAAMRDFLADDTTISPDRAIYRGEVNHALDAGLASIPSEEAMVLRKLFLEHKSLREIEGEIGIPKSTLQRISERALPKMRSLLLNASIGSAQYSGPVPPPSNLQVGERTASGAATRTAADEVTARATRPLDPTPNVSERQTLAPRRIFNPPLRLWLAMGTVLPAESVKRRWDAFKRWQAGTEMEDAPSSQGTKLQDLNWAIASTPLIAGGIAAAPRVMQGIDDLASRAPIIKGFIKQDPTTQAAWDEAARGPRITPKFDLPHLTDERGYRPAAEGQTEVGNIDLTHRPHVANADGSTSTVLSSSYNIDGQEVLLPKISPTGQVLDDKQAVAQYQQTGQHLGKFTSPEAADRVAQQIHEDQAGMLPPEVTPPAGPVHVIPHDIRTRPPAPAQALDAAASAPHAPVFTESDMDHAMSTLDKLPADKQDAYATFLTSKLSHLPADHLTPGMQSFLDAHQQMDWGDALMNFAAGAAHHTPQALLGAATVYVGARMARKAFDVIFPKQSERINPRWVEQWQQLPAPERQMWDDYSQRTNGLDFATYVKNVPKIRELKAFIEEATDYLTPNVTTARDQRTLHEEWMRSMMDTRGFVPSSLEINPRTGTLFIMGRDGTGYRYSLNTDSLAMSAPGDNVPLRARSFGRGTPMADIPDENPFKASMSDFEAVIRQMREEMEARLQLAAQAEEGMAEPEAPAAPAAPSAPRPPRRPRGPFDVTPEVREARHDQRIEELSRPTFTPRTPEVMTLRYGNGETSTTASVFELALRDDRGQARQVTVLDAPEVRTSSNHWLEGGLTMHNDMMLRAAIARAIRNGSQEIVIPDRFATRFLNQGVDDPRRASVNREMRTLAEQLLNSPGEAIDLGRQTTGTGRVQVRGRAFDLSAARRALEDRPGTLDTKKLQEQGSIPLLRRPGLVADSMAYFTRRFSDMGLTPDQTRAYAQVAGRIAQNAHREDWSRIGEIVHDGSGRATLLGTHLSPGTQAWSHMIGIFGGAAGTAPFNVTNSLLTLGHEVYHQNRALALAGALDERSQRYYDAATREATNLPEAAKRQLATEALRGVLGQTSGIDRDLFNAIVNNAATRGPDEFLATMAAVEYFNEARRGEIAPVDRRTQNWPDWLRDFVKRFKELAGRVLDAARETLGMQRPPNQPNIDLAAANDGMEAISRALRGDRRNNAPERTATNWLVSNGLPTDEEVNRTFPEITSSSVQQAIGRGQASPLDISEEPEEAQVAAANLKDSRTWPAAWQREFEGILANPGDNLGERLDAFDAAKDDLIAAAQKKRGGGGTVPTQAPPKDISDFLRILRETDPLDQSFIADLATRNPKAQIGRPDLANPLPTSAARAMLDAVDENRKVFSEKETVEQWGKDADAMIARDRAGTLKTIVSKALNGEVLTDRETIAAIKLQGQEMERYSSMSQRERDDMHLLANSYRETGTSWARAGRARVDLFRTPAERYRAYLAKVLYTPSPAVRRRLDSPNVSAEERRALLSGDQAELKRVEAALNAMGTSLDEIFSGHTEVRLKGAAFVNDAVATLSRREQAAIDMIRKGARPSEIMTATSMTGAEIEGIRQRVREDLKKSLLSKAMAGLTVDNLDAAPTSRAQYSGPAPEGAVSRAQAEAEVERMLDAMGLGKTPEFEKRARRRQGARKAKPSKARAGALTDEETLKPDQTPTNPAAYRGYTPSMEPESAVPRGEGKQFGSLKNDPFARGDQVIRQKEAPRIAGAGKGFDLLATDPFAQSRQIIRQKEAETLRGEGKQERPNDFFKEGATNGYLSGDGPTDWNDFDLSDPKKVLQVAQAIAGVRSSGLDMAREYWMAAILSGVKTHVSNIVGNSGSLAIEFAVQRPTEALVNSMLSQVGLGSKDAAQWGEFSHMMKSFAPALSEATQNFLDAFRSENQVFKGKALADPLLFDAPRDLQHPPAIPGKLGKAIRIPFRLLAAADDFFRTLIGRAQVHAEAYRAAKGLNLTGEAMENYMREEMVFGSDSWQRSMTKADDLLFQRELRWMSEGGNAVESSAKAIMEVTKKMPALAFLVPFVKTPYNIFHTGLRKTPLGTATMLFKFMRKGFYAMTQKGKPEPIRYDRPEQIRDMAEQMLAWGAMALLYGSAEGDDDDDKKWFLITGSRPSDTTARGERDRANRMHGGPTTIRVGGAELNYGRLEPAATTLAALVDIVRALKGNRDGTPNLQSVAKLGGYFVAQTADKTYLKGLSDVMNLISGGVKSSDQAVTAATKWGSDWATSWVPNLLRQPLRSLDDYSRDTGQDMSLGERLKQGMWPLDTSAAKKIDFYGREVQAPAGGPIMRALVPVNVKPDQPIILADRMIENFNRTVANGSDTEIKQFNPEAPRRKMRWQGQDIELPPELFERFQKVAGEELTRQLGWINESVASNPTEAHIERMKKIVTLSRDTAKRKLAAEITAVANGK